VSARREDPSRHDNEFTVTQHNQLRAIAWTAVLAAAVVLAPAAFGDAIFHSHHVAMNAVGGTPLRSGFVEVIHTNGPIVFSHDNYVLNGAAPDTTYTATLHLSTAADTTCSAPSSRRTSRR
jgi:hypothetical protein